MDQQPTIVLSPVLADDILAIGRPMLPAGFNLRVVSADDLPAALPEAEFLMGFIPRLSDETLLSAERLRLVQLMSVGYDRFNLEGARKARVPVAVNGGANAISVAEHAIMLILASLKHLTELDATVRAGGWRAPGHGGLRLYEVWSSTVGIVGMGRIGQEVAKRLQNWSATLVYFDPIRLATERERELNLTYLPLEELLTRADVVSVHVPLNDQTHHLIGARALGLMKPTAVLVNTSRGGLVEEQALVEALRAGRLAAAGLDVLSQEPPPRDHPILTVPNSILTPHVAGPTWQSWPRRFENSFANIARVQRGEPPLWVVPELADLLAFG